LSSSLQTYVAFGIVALAAAYLLWTWLRPKKSSGCGGECASVSPEVKKLRERLGR